MGKMGGRSTRNERTEITGSLFIAHTQGIYKWASLVDDSIAECY